MAERSPFTSDQMELVTQTLDIKSAFLFQSEKEYLDYMTPIFRAAWASGRNTAFIKVDEMRFNFTVYSTIQQPVDPRLSR